jgi:nitrite reductase (NO-forming)
MSEATIMMGDMRYSPDMIQVPAGQPLMLTFINNDSMSHDFVMQDGSRTVHLFVSPGKQIATSLFFNEPGIYRFVCSQSGHQAAGMIGQIMVGTSRDAPR